MTYKYALSKKLVAAHIGHEIVFTEDITVRCSTCGEDIWRQADVNARTREIERRLYARLKVEDPDRIRKINREKSAKRRARVKKDPVKYEAYLAKAREYNARKKLCG
jgi:hypothetical protein